MTQEEILSLTSAQPVSYRSERYPGGGFSLQLDHFSIDEREVIQRLYEQCESLLALTGADADLNEVDAKKLVDFMGHSEFLGLQEQLFEIMGESRSAGNRPKEAIVYTLASGALSSITGYIILLQNGTLEKEYVQSLYYLTRDHLKLMRNLVADLDPVKRGMDETPKLHSLDLLKEKWQTVVYRGFSTEIDVAFHNYFEGQVASRCLEFSEIDNIFYHLANNTLQFSAEKKLTIGVAPTKDQKNLLWVFRNPISAEQEETLRNLVQGGNSVFEHGVSTNPSEGQGFGLGCVADTILHAYGMDDLYEAEKKGYFGWKVQAGVFSLWFHWPMVEEA